jgi:hypothetical protein
MDSPIEELSDYRIRDHVLNLSDIGLKGKLSVAQLCQAVNITVDFTQINL